MSLTTNIDNIYKKGVIGNVRKAQEDSHDVFLKTPNGDVFVVCDGMGGHVGGAVASSTAVKSIKEYLEKEKYPTPIEALNGALQFANMQILGYANDHPELKGMGTTACIVLFQGDEVWVAHVGDSRIYLYLGKEKQLHRITKDHSFVQTLVDAGQITDEEAEHHPNKNRILKALGILPNLEPTFNYQNLPIRPKNGDIFLICSDGLSGMIPDSTIERVLSENGSLEQKGEQLINLAMEGETVQPGGQDNCTLELIQVDNSPWKESDFHSFNPIRSLHDTDYPGSKKSDLKKEVVKESGETKTKKSVSAKLIAAIVVGLLLLGGGGWYYLHQKKIDKQESIEQIRARIGKINTELNSIQIELDDIEKQLEQCFQKKANGKNNTDALNALNTEETRLNDLKKLKEEEKVQLGIELDSCKKVLDDLSNTDRSAKIKNDINSLVKTKDYQENVDNKNHNDTISV